MLKYLIILLIAGWWVAGVVVLLPRGGSIWGDFWATLLVSFGTVAFSIGNLYFMDLLASAMRQNSEFMRTFYRSLYRDVAQSLVAGVILLFVYRLSTQNYSFASIDIGGAALPFLLGGVVAVLWPPTKARRFHRGVFFIASIQVCVLIACCYFLIKVNSGGYSAAASIWLQVSILSAGWGIFVGGRQYHYFLLKRRVDSSEFLKRLFKELRNGQPGPYSDLDELIAVINQNFRRDSAKRAKELRRERKRR
jgi:hypothetical protein